jgi:hypothetical protein
MEPLTLPQLAHELRCAISFSRMVSLQGDPQEYLSLLEHCAVVIERLVEEQEQLSLF